LEVRRQEIIVIGLMLRLLFIISFSFNTLQSEEIMATVLKYRLAFHIFNEKEMAGGRKTFGQLQKGIYLLAFA
jgi:hypothetical protein